MTDGEGTPTVGSVVLRWLSYVLGWVNKVGIDWKQTSVGCLVLDMQIVSNMGFLMVLRISGSCFGLIIKEYQMNSELVYVLIILLVLSVIIILIM